MKIAVIDIETTALKPTLGHIVEIGVVELDTTTGSMKMLFDKLIKESDNIDSTAWIFGHSTLTANDVMSHGVSIESVRAELQHIFDSYNCVAYNYRFDFDWLRNRNFKIEKVAQDPMFLMTEICKLPGKNGFKWPTVQECLNYFKIRETEPHRAGGDVLLEARIIWEMIKSNQYPIDSSLTMADTPEKQIIRYKAKLESYEHLLKVINDKKGFCENKIAELEKAA